VAQNSEASVEEILESIKKVIARDNRDGALEMRRQREAEAEEADPTALETELVEDSPDEVLDLSEMELDDDIVLESWESVEDDTPLIKEEVRGVMQENLAALAMLSEPGARPQIVRSGETSLEGLTRELLRPMLAEWLDNNLPAMVERLVQAEIARIAGKKS
jgi:cell pole-organizing protein PopZ